MKEIFFCSNHPGELSFYYHLVNLLKSNAKDIQVVLIYVKHPYDKGLDLSIYHAVFDKIVRLTNVQYSKNLLKEFRNIFALKNDIVYLKKNFKKSKNSRPILISTSSAEFSVNALTNIFSKILPEATTIVWSYGDPIQYKYTDWLRTILANVYCSLGGLPKVRSVRLTAAQNGTDFVFCAQRNVKRVLISNSAQVTQVPTLPFPLPKQVSAQNLLKVIFFGDYDYYQFYKNEIESEEFFNLKLVEIFSAIKRRFPACEIIYKPHPLDHGRMPAILEAFSPTNLKDPRINAETFMDEHICNISAVFSFSSNACMSAALRHIPAFYLYPIFLTQKSTMRQILDKSMTKQQNPYLSFLNNTEEILNLILTSSEHSFEKESQRWIDFLEII